MTSKQDINILSVRYLKGPNVWNYHSVIETVLDIGEFENYPSNAIAGLSERLAALLPTLVEHDCTPGVRGGFLERLRDGTYVGHILEHVVLELQCLAGMRTAFGRTRQVSEAGVIYKMVFRTDEEQVGRAALCAGRDLLMAAIDDRPYDVAAAVTMLTSLIDRLCLGPSTAHIVAAAAWRGIPAIRLGDHNLVQLGYGARQRRIWTAETEFTSAIGEGISSDKDLTKRLLEACGVPVPDGELVQSAEAAWEAAEDIGVPVVIKPYNGNHGRGVSINLNSRDDVIAAYNLARQEGESAAVIVESMIGGDEYRLLVIGGRLVAAARGESVSVSGDGVATVAQLVEQQINTDPRRGAGEQAPLSRLNPAEAREIVLTLARQGFTAQSVPCAGQRVLIQHNGNVSEDVTEQVHPSVAAIATLAARVVGLDVAGIDLVAEDIARPLDQQSAAIVEINARPGLLAHTNPGKGVPRAVGGAIVKHVFGGEQGAHVGRIPIVGVAGTDGTALIAQLVARLLQLSGKCVGLSCGGGQSVNGKPLSNGALSQRDAAQRLLVNRNVEAAVFESDPRTILCAGLAYDKCLVGVVTAVSETDSLEAFYVHDREQVARVLRTQIDVILPDGVAILNAADPFVTAMAPLCDGAVMLYGLDGEQAAIVAHCASGQRAVFVRDGHMVLATGAAETPLLPLTCLPATLRRDLHSVAAAIGAGWALGMDPRTICAGVIGFADVPACAAASAASPHALREGALGCA